MSSDYIPRLRAELLRAGARSPSRRRVVARPVLALGAVALLVAALVIVLPRTPDDERPAERGDAVRLEYRVAGGDAASAAAILRTRLDIAGIGPAEVSASGGRVHLVAPAAARAALPPLLVPGRFAVYDWEAGVVGGLEPLSASEARARAAAHPGAVAVRSAEDPGKWFALAGTPPITNAAVARAEASTDPAVDEPVVLVSLTAEGRRTFRELTRAVAQRGADEALGADPVQSSQHLAIVVDDRIVSVPYVNWRANPDGIDGAEGVQVAGGLTPESARTLAAVLCAGPLPELSPP
jgi:hypothetical protein